MKYNPSPTYPLLSGCMQSGFINLVKELKISGSNIFLVDGTTALNWDELRGNISSCSGEIKVFDFDICRKDRQSLRTDLSRLVLEDSHFNRYFQDSIEGLFDEKKVGVMNSELLEASNHQPVICMGSGSSLLGLDTAQVVWVSCANRIVHQNISSGNSAFFGSAVFTPGESYEYVDRPLMASRVNNLVNKIFLFVDLSEPANSVFINGGHLRENLSAYASQPFRVQPEFYAKTWGGCWLKENLPVPTSLLNTAGSFEFAQQENDFVFQHEGLTLHVPLNWVIAANPGKLMGNAVFNRFGCEFPFRLNLTDTIEGQDLSCQVHPGIEFTSENYGVSAGVDEKYYVIHAEEGAGINLGLKEDADQDQLLMEAETSEKTGEPFDIKKFVKSWPSEKGKVFLLPPGTIHNICEGNLVMEIISSNTIFTFRLYDYLRMDMHGNPRPLHITEARQVINPGIRSSMVEKELIPQFAEAVDSGVGERSIPCRENSFTVISTIKLMSNYETGTEHEKFHLLTLVEGKNVEINSKNFSHPLNFLETIMVPAGTGPYTITNRSDNQSVLLKVSVQV